MLKISDGLELSCIDPSQLRDLVMQNMHSPDLSTKLFIRYMEHYAKLKEKRNTYSVYKSTISRLMQFNPKMNSVVFDAINPMWLRRFDKWLSENGCPSVNARAVHFRNMRTVFNAAIDDGLTLNYPFRKFKIRHEQTKPKTLSVNALRRMIKLKLEGSEACARDCFLLSFYMFGINMADLILLELSGSRVKYYRQKTNKLYEFKMQPEAKELLGVMSWVKHYKNTHSLVIMINRLLKSVGKKIGYPFLTTYYARYTWATVAASLDIPKETIAEALGHTNKTVTDIYINFDHSKIDKANRTVIDYVLQKANNS
jgi:integrase